MKRFEGQKIVITGGSGGIGLATAARIIEEGGEVLVTGTNEVKLNAAKAQIPGLRTLVNDAGDPEAVATLTSWIKDNFGQIHGLFLNAGYGVFIPHDQITAEAFDQQYNVNVRGPVLQVGAISGLIADGGAVVLNTSVAQDLGMPGAVVYASTKGALRTVTRVLAAELAGRKIRVNAVSPGPISTGFFDRTGMSQEQINGMAEQIVARVPLGRFGTPEDVAAVASFLLSNDAAFVTGSEYVVDGGMTEL
ncbi:MAG: SDR family oxidoreductase [Bradymonadia bacterium]